MAATGTRVRARRSAAREPAPSVAVTGAAGPLGRLLIEHLVAAAPDRQVIAIDTERAPVPGATWRLADVRDPALRTRLTGVGTVVHLAGDRDPASDADERRALNVRGTEVLLDAAHAAGVRRLVLLTSAMVYGALADNPVPLPDDAPLRAEPDRTLVGDWLEMERVATKFVRTHPRLELVRVRPASIVGPVTDAAMPRMFDAPRLLVLRGSRPRWQFCHVDDLVAALEWAAAGRVAGAVTVGCDGWLDQSDVERISGLRSLVVPSAVAFATAERLHRVGVLPAPASELRYLAHPWVVGSDTLRAAGWLPAWTNEDALAAHVGDSSAGAGRDAARGRRRDATRAAAGAAVAVAGTVAVARARAARRRRRA